MGLLTWIAIGAIAGCLAVWFTGTREGLFRTVVLGIVGGLVGGFVATTILHVGTVDGINLGSIVIATLGAIAILLALNLAAGSGVLRHRPS
jgi:uncharacterized membrane protein YeaQ/YmgE (transglycosylase-associated protein family)